MNKEEFEKHKPFAGEKKPSMLRRRVGHDYESRRMYLITMTVEDRRPLLGRLVGRSDAKVGSPDYPHVELSELGKVVEYFVNAFYENVTASAMGVDTDSAKLTVEHPDFKPAIDSKDYYGIVEIIYFGWCAIVAGAGIFMNEKKYKIRKRYQVANLSSFKEYLGKFVPLAIVASLGTVAAG